MMMMSDDPLSAALAEAESFIESLGTSDDNHNDDGVMITSSLTDIHIDDEFAIDSDEEGNDNHKDTNTKNQEVIQATGGVPQQQQQQPPPPASQPFHPLLSGLFPTSATTTTTTAADPPSSMVATSTNPLMMPSPQQQQQQQPVVVSPPASAASFHPLQSMTPMTTPNSQPQPPHHQQQQQPLYPQQPQPQQQRIQSLTPQGVGMNHPQGMYQYPTMTATAPVVPAPTGPSMDMFKASTSRFASGLANIAQRAANTVVQTASGVGGPTAAPMYPQQPQPPMYPYGAPAAVDTMPQPQSPSPSQYVQQQQQQQQQQQPPPPPPELEQEQKMALVREHVGPLLKGEHVIMFLSNLVHVSDSCSTVTTTNQPGNSNQVTIHPPSSNPSRTMSNTQNDYGWCCAVTYYRIILFNTASKTNDYAITNDDEVCPNNWYKSCWPMKPLERVIQIPLACIEKIERCTFSATIANTTNPSYVTNYPTNTPTSNIVGLILYSKISGRQIRLIVSYIYSETIRVHEILANYAFPGRKNLGYLFAFEGQREVVMDSIVIDPTTGQKNVTLTPFTKRFDAFIEYYRQLYGIMVSSPEQVQQQIQQQQMVLPQRPWSLWTNMNQSYQLCQSYPSIIVGPTSLNTESTNTSTALEAHKIIKQCAAFRSEYRLPTLSWTASDGSGSSLWRSSQPKVGLQGNRNTADELYMKHIIECAAAANMLYQQSPKHGTGNSGKSNIPIISRQVMIQLTGSYDTSYWTTNHIERNFNNFCGLKILDLRPRSSAMANRTAGYGYENTSYYPGTTLQFCNIGNIHTVRDSYQKLCQICNNSYNPAYDQNWTQIIEDTKWLHYIRLILSASWEAAYWVHIYKLPVLIHCSHGWDRTSQVIAIAQILLDPYYRTIDGIACLIEKDFCSFGHPFHTRCGHGEGVGPSGTNDSQHIHHPHHISSSSGSLSGNSPGNIIQNNPIFNTIQQHMNNPTNLLSTFGGANTAVMSSSSSTHGASSSLNGGSTPGGDYNATNNNNNNNGFDESQLSPIFIQFLDCLYQLVDLYPDAFEYNTKYILLLSEHIYSGRFGNFLCDTERERETIAAIRQRTTSVWDYLSSRPDIINRNYHRINSSNDDDTNSTNHGGVLLMPLPLLLRNVKLWTDRHCKYSSMKITNRCQISLSMLSTNYYDTDYYVQQAMIQNKFRNQEQTPIISSQEYHRILLSTSATTTTTATSSTTSSMAAPAVTSSFENPIHTPNDENISKPSTDSTVATATTTTTSSGSDNTDTGGNDTSNTTEANTTTITNATSIPTVTP